MVNLVFYMVTVCSEIWFRPSSLTSFPVLNYSIIKTCNATVEIIRKLTCSNFLEIQSQTSKLVSLTLCSVLSNISNTRDSVSSGYPNIEKRVENTTRSGVFLTKIADETVSRVFDISSQSKQKLRSKRRSKIAKSMLIKTGYPSLLALVSLFVLTWWIIYQFEKQIYQFFHEWWQMMMCTCRSISGY